MAQAYKLNKSELTRMQRELGIYHQYLPVLKLKKEQLQAEHGQLKRTFREQQERVNALRQQTESFIPLLAEPLNFNVVDLVRPTETIIEERIVAGLRMPVLTHVAFPTLEPPRFGPPPWLSKALPILRQLKHQQILLAVLQEQFKRLDRELRKTTQKVNLFEKVLVPDTQEAIKRIKIALGDLQVAAVCRAKIAKGKKDAAAEVTP